MKNNLNIPLHVPDISRRGRVSGGVPGLPGLVLRRGNLGPAILVVVEILGVAGTGVAVLKNKRNLRTCTQSVNGNHNRLGLTLLEGMCRLEVIGGRDW